VEVVLGLHLPLFVQYIGDSWIVQDHYKYNLAFVNIISMGLALHKRMVLPIEIRLLTHASRLPELLVDSTPFLSVIYNIYL